MLSLSRSAAPARAARVAPRASPRDVALLSAAASAALLLAAPAPPALARLPDNVAAPSLAAQQALEPASDKARKLFEELESKPLPSGPVEEAKPRASVLQPSAPAVAPPPKAAPAPAASAPAPAAARPTLNAAKSDGPSPVVIVGALGVLGVGAAIASNNSGAAAEGAPAAAAAPPPPAAAAAPPPAEPAPVSSDSSSTGAQ